MHLRTGDLARVDEFFRFQIGVGFDAPRRADGSDTTRQVKPRKTEDVRRIGARIASAGRWIIQVVVHPHQTGKNCVAGQVELLCVLGDPQGRTRPHHLDLSTAQDDGLVIARSAACAVDHPHMQQCNHWRIYFDERLDLWR